MIVLIGLWLVIIIITAVNMYRQYQVSQQQMRIINDYKLKSEVQDIFKNVQDSLSQNIKTAERLAKELDKPFPFSNKSTNWLFIRLMIILLTVATGLNYFLYYRKQSR